MHRSARYALACLALAACGGEDNGGNGPGNSLVVSPQALSIRDCGGTGQITASVHDGEGNVVPGATITYTSRGPGIATVVGGVVTGQSIGTTEIIAASGQLKDTVAITVINGPISVIAGPDSMNLDVDGTRPLTVTVTNCHAAVVANPVLTLVAVPSILSFSGSRVIADAPGVTKIAIITGILGDTVSATDTVVVNVYSASHPGTAHTTFAVNNTPFGIATSGSGLVYVTKLLGVAVGHDTLPLAGPITAQFSVGDTPTDIEVVPRELKAFVTNQGSGSLGVIDAGANIQSTTVPLGDSPFRVLSARVGNETYVSLAGGKIIILNSTTNAKLDSVVVDGAPNGMTLGPPGSDDLYVSSTASGRVLKIHLSARTVVDSFVVGGVPQELVLSPDGLSLFVANEMLGLQQIDLFTGAVSPAIPMPAFGMALTPDGAQLFVVGGSTVTVVDMVTLTAAPGINVGGNARRVAFAWGGRLALISNEGGWVSVIQ
ncbi:MAG: hypothetical protein ABI836_12565 [Gemmatimonadota bacterium]